MEIKISEQDAKQFKIITVLNQWVERCHNARNGHYKQAEKLFNLSRNLGYILICSTVFVTVFSLFKPEETPLIFGINRQHIIVLVGAIAAVISGIVTQAKFGERAEMHRSSGARYANLARDIEVFRLKIISNLVTEYEQKIGYEMLVDRWNNLSDDSLLTPHDEKSQKNWKCIIFILLPIFIFFLVLSSGEIHTSLNENELICFYK